MDKTKYPFNGAAPVRRKTIPTAPADASRSFGNGRDVPGRDPGHYYPPAAPGPLSQFPATGVGETFKGLTLSRDDLEAAKTWEASSAWFGDLLTQTWANDNSKSGLFSKTVGGHQQQQSEPITFPRTITGDELEHYGVAGKGRKAQLRRQFREIHGKKVLSRLSPEYAPEKPDMLEPEGARKREWVMVAKVRTCFVLLCFSELCEDGRQEEYADGWLQHTSTKKKEKRAFRNKSTSACASFCRVSFAEVSVLTAFSLSFLFFFSVSAGRVAGAPRVRSDFA